MSVEKQIEKSLNLVAEIRHYPMIRDKFISKNSQLGIVVFGLFLLIFLFQGKLNFNQKPNNSAPIGAPSPSLNENSLLNFPSDLSDHEGKRWVENIIRIEKTDQIINFNNCKPSPLVLKVVKGTEFQMKNNDNIEITIYSHGKEFKILPGSTLDIKASFEPNAAGFFGYRCQFGSEPISPVVGILHLTD